MRNLKIGTKILAVILLVSLCSLFFISVVSYTEMLNLTRYSTDANTQLGVNSSTKSKLALRKQAEEYISKIAKEQAQKSDAVLLKVQKEIDLSSEFLSALYRNEKNFAGRELPLVPETEMGVASTKYMLPKDVVRTPKLTSELRLLSNAEYLFAPLFGNNEILNNIYLGTQSGISLRYSKSNAYNPDYDPRERNWYKSAMANAGRSTWVDTYLDAFGSICVTNARTFDGAAGSPQGVVATDITLRSMQDDILSLKIGQTGYAFMLDNKGSVIAHPKYDATQKTNPLENATGDYLEALKEIVAQPGGLTSAHVDGKLSYLAYAKLPTTNWSLVIVVEVDEIVQPAEETRKQIDQYTTEAQRYISQTLSYVLIRLVITLAVSGMVILVFSYLISRTITNPIKLLVERVALIGKGNLEVRIDDRGKDEIAELAVAFNRMTEDLKQHIADISRISAEKERISAELDVARDIQAHMLPCIFPAFPDRPEFDIYATMQPAKEVGGDFYDFFLIDADHLAIVIADVSGKGVPAALFMVIAKTLIKNSAQFGNSPKTVLETVNNQLCEHNDAAMFVTAFIGVLEISTGAFAYANAGHNPPLIKRGPQDFAWLPTHPGLVLAGIENTAYLEDHVILEPGDTLFLYTDGVTEAENGNSELFSNARLVASLNRIGDAPPAELLAGIKHEIDVFADGAHQADDITMLALAIRELS